MAYQNREARRDEIADALLALLPELGYERASIQAIAREAGVRPGLVHYHFKNKLEVLEHGLVRLESRLVARIEHLMSEVKGTPSADASSADVAAHDEPDGDRVLSCLLRGLVGVENADRSALDAWCAVGAEAHRLRGIRSAYTAAQKSFLQRLQAVVDADTALSLLMLIQGAFHLGVTTDLVAPGDAYRLAMNLAVALRPEGG